eukprot:TRINITY_DN56469_c0_g1_i1.p1 TRINITY_DN56469_c0_g1~~TRINITY_DN56469_c0_g1_i1.p1  ORF type:complete len:215 (+),score=33.95 TRINITY_DN56469_c0_g1_i1:28-645(+)
MAEDSRPVLNVQYQSIAPDAKSVTPPRSPVTGPLPVSVGLTPTSPPAVPGFPATRPLRAHLKVTVHEAKGLQLKPHAMQRKPAPFVQLKAVNITHKTKAHRTESDPVWDEVFVFPVVNWTEEKLIVTARDHHTAGSDTTIGQPVAIAIDHVTEAPLVEEINTGAGVVRLTLQAVPHGRVRASSAPTMPLPFSPFGGLAPNSAFAP